MDALWIIGIPAATAFLLCMHRISRDDHAQVAKDIAASCVLEPRPEPLKVQAVRVSTLPDVVLSDFTVPVQRTLLLLRRQYEDERLHSTQHLTLPVGEISDEATRHGGAP